MESVEHDASEVDVLLFQMIIFCGEFFKEDFLRRCSRSIDYFRLDCASLSYSLWSFFLTNTAYNQADSRNSSTLVANRLRNVFKTLDVY